MLDDIFIDILEDTGWSVRESSDFVELAKHSPAGEDFILEVETKDFVNNIKIYYDDFDEEEHATMWIVAKANDSIGIPSIRELIDDADAIKEMLKDLSERLQKIN